MRRAVSILTIAGTLVAANVGSGVAQTAAPAPVQVPVPDPAQQAAEILQTCIQCHGAGGVSHIPSRPSIAGQKVDYVARQLQAFKRAAATRVVETGGDADDADAAKAKLKSSSRFDPIMGHMTQGLDNAMIRRVAASVGALSCAGKDTPRKDVAKLPKAPPSAQRCVACHGEDGIGRSKHIPNLAGQQRAYLRRQLLLIRETAWGAEPREHESWRSHPIMERQAARISIEDVDALARYYASLDCRGAVKP